MVFTIIKGGSLRSPPAPGCGRPQAAVLAGAPPDATTVTPDRCPRSASSGRAC